MIEIPKMYWDACIWIELINSTNRNWVARCSHVLELAENNKVELWTSALTLAEVYKKKCHGEKIGIVENEDERFENLIQAEFVRKINVDIEVGNLARRLLRKYPKIGKPQDAIHVASCLIYNLDELHTFDEEDLLGFDNVLMRKDKKPLKICKPPMSAEPDMFADSP